MRVRPLIVAVPLLAGSLCLLSLPRATAQTSATVSAPSVVERATSPLSLWTSAQLAEPDDPARARAERFIRNLRRPDFSPPARTAPLVRPSAVTEALRGIIRRVHLAPGDRRVAITFDLCERAAHVTGYDARLVDALRQADAKATFFAGGKWMRSHPERAQQLMADSRFELGNHSWTHANMLTAPPDLRRRQVDWTAGEYELLREGLDRRLDARGLPSVARGPLTLFRLPYGRGDSGVAAFLNDLGYAVIQWDVVGETGRGDADAQAHAEAIVEAIRPGSIVLLHANAVPQGTAEVVRRLLPLLAARGYVTATVSELLAAGRPETVEDGYFTTPGDNRIYDEVFEDYGTGPRRR